jgi:ATP-dependent Clp protease ATP-binding subunit ClpX
MLNKKGGNTALFCCICGKESEKARDDGEPFFRTHTPTAKLSVAICAGCVANAYQVLKDMNPDYYEEREVNLESLIGKVPTPKNIFDRLNEYVIGQEKSKKSLSVALANHFHRIHDATIQKSNVLLIGPTGTGKTELARAAAKILDLPFVIADATTFTAHGYVGEDVENILTRLYQESGSDIQKAQCGIVFIDEIDKLADSENNSFVGTLAVQQSLLKMLEGTLVNVPKVQKTRGEAVECVPFDTSRVLFICAGAFSGLDDLIRLDIKRQSTMGLNANPMTKSEMPDDLLKILSSTHLIKFGLIPEFLGRFQIITNTQPLNLEALEKILTEPANAVTKQYKKLLSKYNVNLEFSKEFLQSVAKEAQESGIGARGLKKILEQRLEKIIFEAPELEESKKNIIL